MKIGVWVPSGTSVSIGGGFSYPEKLISSIDRYQFSEGIDIFFVSLDDVDNLHHPFLNISRLKCLRRITKRIPTIKRYVHYLDRLLIKTIGLSSILKSIGIKFILYTEQMVCLDPDFPFIAMNWDIGHLSTYPFPEILSSFKYRDDFYSKILPRSMFVSCESMAGMNELKKYTRIGEHKLRVVPLFAGNVSDLKLSKEECIINIEKIGLKSHSYFYYPAQFWAHKNHFGLLSAFKRFVENTDSSCKLVLSGSHRRNYNYIMELISELGLDSNVIVLGFISNELVYSLYKEAIALVMPSHFGSTNMPPIEAMEIGCPVVCSNLEGHKEILGDSGEYFESLDNDSIFEALNNVYRNNEKYRDLIVKRRESNSFNVHNALMAIDDLLLEAVNLRRNWP